MFDIFKIKEDGNGIGDYITTAFDFECIKIFMMDEDIASVFVKDESDTICLFRIEDFQKKK